MWLQERVVLPPLASFPPLGSGDERGWTSRALSVLPARNSLGLCDFWFRAPPPTPTCPHASSSTPVGCDSPSGQVSRSPFCGLSMRVLHSSPRIVAWGMGRGREVKGMLVGSLGAGLGNRAGCGVGPGLGVDTVQSRLGPDSDATSVLPTHPTQPDLYSCSSPPHPCGTIYTCVCLCG